MKKKLQVILMLFLLVLFVAAPAYASRIFSVEGTSVPGVPVSFSAEFNISGDILTLTLSNTSTTSSANPDDLLSSFYFDIIDGTRPTLVYESATGDTYLNNVLQQAGEDLKTGVTLPPPPPSGKFDSWVYDTMDDSSSPFLGFGIGTVGNNLLTPNNFQGSLVDGFDLSIYAGTIATSNLNTNVLVKDSAVFTFSGLNGYTEDDISNIVTFGLGTGPDSLISTPIPSTVVLLAFGLIGLLALRRKTIK